MSGKRWKECEMFIATYRLIKLRNDTISIEQQNQHC